jgi:sec-independent protein translocase protein TatB
MFDIGFMELLLIGIVALLVLGPDKLPGAIRTGALWLGRARRSFNKVKTEIEQQLNTDEIRRQLHNESILADIDKARKSADKLMKDTQANIKEAQAGVENTITSTTRLTTSADEGVPTPPPEPAVAEAKANVEARYKKLADNSDDDNANLSDDAKPDSQTEAVADSFPDSPDSDPEPANPAAQDSKHKQNTKQPVQDFYNSPPQGVVTVSGGKLSAADKQPKASKHSPDKESSD